MLGDSLKTKFNVLHDVYIVNKKEFSILMRWSTPLIISNLLNNVTFLFVNLIFIGRLSREELAAAALANTWTYCTLALGSGVANAMDTLVSQSYGAGNNKLVSLTAQRASIIATFCSIFIAVLWALTEKVLLLVRQESHLSYLAFQYALYMLPGLWFTCVSTVLQKYLQGQAIMWPSIVIGIIMNGFNALFNYIFIHGTGSFDGIGFVGSPLATSISRIISFFLMVLLIWYFKLHEETWNGWEREALSIKGFKEYLSLGIPAAIQHASEGWGFEVLTILAGLINAASLDAHSVVYNFTMLTYQFPSGIATAVSVRVGQLLGQKNEVRAKAAAWVAFIISMFFMVVIAIIQYTCRNVIGKIYTNDQGVIDIAATILPISAIFQIFDGGQTIFQGIVRGMGRVKVGAAANFVAFYIISIPIGVILAFPVDIGVKGLWWGLCIGLFCIFIGLGVVIIKVNWKIEVDKATIRTKSGPIVQPNGVIIELDTLSMIKNDHVVIGTIGAADGTVNNSELIDSSVTVDLTTTNSNDNSNISFDSSNNIFSTTPGSNRDRFLSRNISTPSIPNNIPFNEEPSSSPVITRARSSTLTGFKEFKDSITPNKCNPQ